MIIPVRCFTCNNVLASKYKKYLEIISSQKKELSLIDSTTDIENLPKSIENIAFEELKLKRYCCKRHLLTHVDLMEKI